MTDITMLIHNRPIHTKQSLESLIKNTKEYNLFALYHKCNKETLATRKLIPEIDWDKVCEDLENTLGTGELRNTAINVYMELKTAHKYLYLSDNDVYFQKDWLETLIECYEFAHENYKVIALGAYVHPYNRPYKLIPFYSNVKKQTLQIGLLNALSTQSWLWKWEDWNKYGPFVNTPPGKVRQSEDVDMSNRIQNDGFKVACVYPSLIYNTSITDSFGELVPGHELIERPKGIYIG